MINRTIKKDIINSINSKPITLITGARQVGKSTLCYQLKKELGYEYISLDDIRNRQQALSDPELFLKLHKAPLIMKLPTKVAQNLQIEFNLFVWNGYPIDEYLSFKGYKVDAIDISKNTIIEAKK